MPLKRRRNSGQGDGIDRDIKESSTGNENTGITSEKHVKVGIRKEDVPTNQEKPSSSKTITKTDTTAGSSKPSTDTARVGAFTRSRVVKKPRRDLSPPESPVKKPIPKDTKTNTPETKTKRQWELWSTDDKDSFFEGLFEHGKDFDAIQNWIALKCKRKNVAPSLIKNKDQVRHLYYRTWHKISKFIDVTPDVKKETQELYGLINYGALRKKITGVLNEKHGVKLNELIYVGYTTIKYRGKNLRIKTPMCNALKRLNNIDNDSKSESTDKVPDKILVEMTPRTNAAWSAVQELATNPRLRMLLKGDRKLSSVIGYMNKKWKSHRIKLKESLDGENDVRKILTVYPHRDCEVLPVTLHSIKETKINLSFTHYKQNLKNSPSVGKGKKSEPVVVPTTDSSSLEGTDLVTGMFDSPRSNKSSKESKTDSLSSFKVDISALGDGDNAMFPDTLLSPSQKKDTSCLNKGGSSNTIELSCGEVENMDCGLADQGSSGCDSDRNVELTPEEKEANESKKMKEMVEGGMDIQKGYMSLAELYLMFGKDGKLKLEYEWCREEMQPSQLTNMLRRLVHLATIQFTDLSTKTPSNTSTSPCHACGAVKPKSSKVNNSARGQRGRCPLLSKSADGMVDASTQTQNSILPTKKNDNASQVKDAVFRVPVCSPAFLQRSVPPTKANHPLITPANLYPTQSKGIRKIRTSRKPMSVQRSILPKQPMVTFLRPVGQHQPLSIPVACQGLVNVPNNNLHLNPNVSTASPGGTPVQLNVQPSSQVNRMPAHSATPAGTPIQLNVQPQLNPLSTNSTDSNNVNQLLSGINIDVPTSLTTFITVSESSTVKPQTTTSSLSPPNISSLLEISLSNLPGTASESSDKLIDMALGNSNTFSALLDSRSRDTASDSLLSTPKQKNGNKFSPPASPANPWLNGGEDGNELNFMNLLTESPIKPPQSFQTVTTSSLQTAPLFSESSRDSIMGRFDVDGTLQSVLNENSIDYAVKFQDLAAHISGTGENSLLSLRKTDTSG